MHLGQLITALQPDAQAAAAALAQILRTAADMDPDQTTTSSSTCSSGSRSSPPPSPPQAGTPRPPPSLRQS